MGYLVTTTGTAATVTLNDLFDQSNGPLVLTHPVTNLDLTINNNTDNLRYSADLQTAITNGEVIVTIDGVVINDITLAGLGSGKAQAGTISSIELVINANNYDIRTGIKGTLEIPFDCTITSAALISQQTGNLVVDIKTSDFATYPTTTTIINTGSGGIRPNLSSSSKYKDTTLTGWNRVLSQGDIIEYEVVSVSGIQNVTISLRVSL